MSGIIPITSSGVWKLLEHFGWWVEGWQLEKYLSWVHLKSQAYPPRNLENVILTISWIYNLIYIFWFNISIIIAVKMLAPPGGLARAGTRSTVTTCDEYPQPFVALVVMVLILLCFFHIKCVFSEVDCVSCFQMQLIIECFDNVQTSAFFAKSGGKINNHL